MFLVERSKKTPVHGWLMLGSNCFARLLRQEFIYHIDWIGRAKPMSPSQDGMQPLFHSGGAGIVNQIGCSTRAIWAGVIE